MKKVFLSAIISTSILASCSNEDDAGQIIIENQIEAPATYTFERDGESTVSFSGQTARIAMADELYGATVDFQSTEQLMLDMFANVNSPFSTAALNESGKSIKSKVAASADYFATNTAVSNAIKTEFEAMFETQANTVFPNQNVLATAGTAGQIMDGTSVRYITGQGLEMNQIFAKSLIGALMLDQALNNYLSPVVLDAGSNRANNENDITVEGKSYTTMEHKWDEAYGYLYGASQNPADPNMDLGADRFLNEYLRRLENDEDFAGIAGDIYDAFKLGRAAIVAGDYEVRDEQAAIIKAKLSMVPAVRAVFYLMDGKADVENQNMGSAFHGLSEGLGFVYSLQFTHNPETGAPYFSRDEVIGFMDAIMAGENGLWSVNTEVLESISTAIAARFDFTVEQTIN